MTLEELYLISVTVLNFLFSFLGSSLIMGRDKRIKGTFGTMEEILFWEKTLLAQAIHISSQWMKQISQGERSVPLFLSLEKMLSPIYSSSEEARLRWNAAKPSAFTRWKWKSNCFHWVNSYQTWWEWLGEDIQEMAKIHSFWWKWLPSKPCAFTQWKSNDFHQINSYQTWREWLGEDIKEMAKIHSFWGKWLPSKSNLMDKPLSDSWIPKNFLVTR